ncbi:MAG: CPBP family intramembrane metalloprotease [Pseudobutyrivibrio sp.]|nr:CPBP family intramembrane metalloprotease [Pseudobutyrivibrio sp.]
MKTFFKKIHTENFRWYDEAILVMLFATFMMIICGQIMGGLVEMPFTHLIQNDSTGYWRTFFMYFGFIGTWIVFMIEFLIVKKDRPILRTLWTTPKGNNIKYLGLGFLIGFVLNIICAIVAVLNKDISLQYDSFNFIKLLLLFIAVFMQSSAEEMVCRGFIFQRLRRGYRHPAVAIILNSLLFTSMHLFNPGASVISMTAVLAAGLLFSLMVYYMDSIWCAMAAHTAWNFTQNLILGLPNSGMVSPVSVFKLDAATAKSSFAYSVEFGLEGSITAITVMIITGIVIIVLYHKKEITNG